jgi:glutathione S-transferase
MPELTLVIGNKNYSSWSLRPWLAMKHARIPFREVRIPLYQPDSKARLLEYSPAGKVPVLVDGAVTVWESLAILEYLADKFPRQGFWPEDAAARAHARAISAEMHAGFGELRRQMSMNVRRSLPGRPGTPEVDADIARITWMWLTCFERYGGPFLFGGFGAADAMYAPVAGRFATYGVVLPPRCRQYVDTVLALPAMQEWYAAARAEAEVLPQFEPETASAR